MPDDVPRAAIQLSSNLPHLFWRLFADHNTMIRTIRIHGINALRRLNGNFCGCWSNMFYYVYRLVEPSTISVFGICHFHFRNDGLGIFDETPFSELFRGVLFLIKAMCDAY